MSRISATDKKSGALFTFSEVDITNMSANDKARFDWQVDATPVPQFVQEALAAKQTEAAPQTDNQPAKRGRKNKQDG